jgi:hypothetical protein
MTLEDVHRIIRKYVTEWNARRPDAQLYALVSVPQAGMHLRFSGYFIWVHAGMVPESILTTFFHEYGHAEYENEHQQVEYIATEVAAILSSLTLCVAEGFEQLAYREAENMKLLASNEPYKSAVARLQDNPVWRKYARLDT